MYRLSIAVALLTLFVGWLELSWTVALLCTLLVYLASGGWRFVRIFCLTFPRDCRLMFFYFKVFREVKKSQQNNQTVQDIFKETVHKHSNKIAFVFEDKQWTFKEVEMFSNRVANYFQSIGYKKGDVVALFMENRPELVFFWLGLSKIGVISSLVNYNLRKESLSHCISIVKSKGLIYSSDPNIADAIAHIHSSIEDIELFEFGAAYSNGLTSKNILEKLENCSHLSPPSTENYEKTSNDILLYMYTSGTTGFPKACVIRHIRVFSVGFLMSMAFNYGSNDVMYCVLPLYHTLALFSVFTATLKCGVTTVVRRKFSASLFWEECIHYKATCTIYIGELCRYLLAQPPKETDKMHKVRFMSGNGLRPQIWNEFQKRFNIPLIAEMYGSTEGNVVFMNYIGYPGAVGFFPVAFSRSSPWKIFKMDPLTTELCRGPDGLCIPCKPGEIGQIAGRIGGTTSSRFDGYVDQTATEKKIACDVMKKGDRWFLSGDSLVCDELGCVYFHDRLGDTYRWRAENVSTGEVEAIITKVLGLVSVVVYGVQIPGCEGRAGMAAIEDPDDAIDIKFLGSKLPEVLPSYAQPIFLRITKSVDTTGTFKFQKSKLREEGFNLSIVKDKLFYLDQKSGEYRVLTEEIYQKFQDGEMRF